MKKQFFFLAMAMMTMTAFSQTKGKTPDKAKVTAPVTLGVDSTGVGITDTSKVISIRDIQTFDVLLSKIPHDKYMQLTPNDAIKEFYLWIMQRYQKLPADSKK